MTDLFEIIEDEAKDFADKMGTSIARIQNVKLVSVSVENEPRYKVKNQSDSTGLLHEEKIKNCRLSSITRTIQYSEERAYNFSVQLDARLRAGQTGQVTLQKELQVPLLAGVRGTLQGTFNIELSLGEQLRGAITRKKTYSDNLSYRLDPCTVNRFRFTVAERTLSGTVEADLRIIGFVTAQLRQSISGGVVTFGMSLPVNFTTTVEGTFSGLVAEDVNVDSSQVACRKQLCGALSDEQLWKLWGLSGVPSGKIPTEFDAELDGEWTEEESSDMIYTGPEELNCGNSFRITAAGFGASEAEAIKDAQERADAGADHHCPVECPEVRIDWDVDRCDETEDTSWMCLGTGVYECREQ